MTDLSEQELREIADEAGLSREQLREAMEVRDLPARIEGTAALMEAPTQGMSVAHAEAELALPPPQALGAVRAAIERHTGARGHGQGDDQADVVDEAHGLTYRIRSREGDGGALVRVDVDPSRARGMQTLLTAGVGGISLTMILLGWWLWTTLLIAGAGLGAVGGAAIWLRGQRLRAAERDARAIAQRSLSDASAESVGAG